MYIWVGVDVEEQLQSMKILAKAVEEAIGFTHSNFTLPMHVSLKMSFFVADERFEEAVEALAEFFNGLSPFSAPVEGVEQLDGIVWIRLRENAALNAVHDGLNNLMRERFGVGLHAYDEDYKFHVTLFMDEEQTKLKNAYKSVVNAPLPPSFSLNRFVIGCSPNGKLGSYQVYKRVDK